MRSKRLLGLGVLCVAALSLTACGSDNNATATPAGDSAKATIEIKTFQFVPKPAQAPAGTITVTNLDNTTHTFTSGKPGAPDKKFTTLTLEGPNASGTVQLEAGTYPFFCEIHTSMTGALTVT
jgi:plastocyanin